MLLFFVPGPTVPLFSSCKQEAPARWQDTGGTSVAAAVRLYLKYHRCCGPIINVWLGRAPSGRSLSTGHQRFPSIPTSTTAASVSPNTSAETPSPHLPSIVDGCVRRASSLSPWWKHSLDRFSPRQSWSVTYPPVVGFLCLSFLALLFLRTPSHILAPCSPHTASRRHPRSSAFFSVDCMLLGGNRSFYH